MHNLLRCRRGSAAFATVVALVPLIGVVALGGEAGSWYVTKQHAQNAADAAAYLGRLAAGMLDITEEYACDPTQTMDYRGKQFAAQNAFCNAGDLLSWLQVCCLRQERSQTVQIDRPTGSRVRATVSQQQPAYLAKVLGLSTVNIGATAIAQVQFVGEAACVLALTGLYQFPRQPQHQSRPTAVSRRTVPPKMH